jgi:hypothetical protein
MGRVAAILDTIALAPLVDGLRCHPPVPIIPRN